MVAKLRKADHWRLTDDEAAMLDEATINLWEYLPIPRQQRGVIAASTALVGAAATVVGPRVLEDRLHALAAQRPPGMSESEAVDELFAAMYSGVQPEWLRGP